MKGAAARGRHLTLFEGRLEAAPLLFALFVQVCVLFVHSVFSRFVVHLHCLCISVYCVCSCPNMVFSLFSYFLNNL